MVAQPESERRYTEFDTSDLKDDDSFDWSTTGKVQTVKNQGSCGSCWAFGANAALESAYAIAYGQLYDLSEQELVDCTRNYGNYGCGGGWHYNSYRYIEDKSGIAQNGEYPYVGTDQSCKANYGVRSAKVNGHSQVKADSNQLKAALKRQPIAVAVDATNWSSYSGGVFVNCGNSINHIVLAVGFQGDDYWILKNSWGTRWGLNGYIRVKGGNSNYCEVLSSSFYPIV